MAWAQAPVPAPGSASPGVIRRQFERPPEAQATPRGEPLAQEVPITEEARQLRFRVRNVAISGVTVYRAGELDVYFQGLAGREVSLAEVLEAANRMTARYRRDGWVLSQVIVPDQDVRTGQLRFQAVEGFIGRTRLEGDIRGPRFILEQHLAAIARERPLAGSTLERHLLLMGDLPGVNARAVLQPAPDQFGAADLTAVITQRPYQAFVGIDNRNSRLNGPWSGQLGLSLFSPFGLYEQFDLLLVGSPRLQELSYAQIQATLPLAVFNLGEAFLGDTIQFSVDHTGSEPSLRRLGIDGFRSRTTGTQARLTWYRPVIRSRDQNLIFRLSGIWSETTTRPRFDDVPLDETRESVRILQARLTYDWVDGLDGINLADVSGNIGIDAFGARITSGIAKLRPGFGYVRGSLARVQPLLAGFTLFAEVQGQYAFDPLPTTERFDIGGVRFGRGFAPGSVTGDSGLAGKVELRYGQSPNLPFLASYQIYGFYDIGVAYDRTGDRDGLRRESLSSAGFGVRFNVNENLSINPEISHQLTGRTSDRIVNKRETRGLISIIARF